MSAASLDAGIDKAAHLARTIPDRRLDAPCLQRVVG
jgi:hypothetical protein